MTREQRAKQFAPFDALKGLHEAMREKEEKHLREEKKTLSEDLMNENSYVLLNLKVGDAVSVKYYLNGHYVKEDGIVSKIRHDLSYLEIKNITISYGDIYSIEKL